jgi:hypothetical protein
MPWLSRRSPAGLLRVHGDSPAARVQAFLDAGERGDDEAVRSLLTLKARQYIRASSSGRAKAARAQDASYRVGATKDTGNTAYVAVTMKDRTGERECHVMMRRDEGEWRIHAFAFRMPDGKSEITLDFEHPETMFAAFGAAMGQGLRMIGAEIPDLGDQLGRGLRALGEGFAKGVRRK